MTDKTQPVKAVEPEVEKSSRIKNFIAIHPRLIKVAGYITAATVVTGVGLALRNRGADTTDPDFDATGATESDPEIPIEIAEA